MYFLRKIKLITIAALLFAAATPNYSLSAQPGYYGKVWRDSDGVFTLFIRYFESAPQNSSTELTNHRVIYASGNMVPTDEVWAVRRIKFEVDEKFKPQHTDNWFLGLYNVEEVIGLEKLNTSACTSMENMFAACYKIKSLNLSNFNTENVTNMEGMFQACFALEYLDLSSFNTKKVTSMTSMFENCPNLKTVDLGNFNASSMIYMGNMFLDCSSLEHIYCNNTAVLPTNNKISHIFGNNSNLKGLTTEDTEVRFEENKLGLDAFKFANQGGYITKKIDIVNEEIVAPTKTTYRLGEDLDLSGGYIRRIIKYGPLYKFKEIKLCELSALKGIMTEYNKEQLGSHVISLAYNTEKFGKLNFSFSVYVEDYLTEVSVTSDESVTEYNMPFSIANLSPGGVIKKLYASGREEILDMSTQKYSIKGLDTTALGEQTITLSYDLNDTIFDYQLSIYIDGPVGLELISEAKNKSFTLGNPYDLGEIFQNLAFEIQMYSGKKDTVLLYPIIERLYHQGSSTDEILAFMQSLGYDIELYNKDSLGTQKISIKYGELEISWEVELIDGLLDIRLAKQPDKILYYIGEKLKLSEVLEGMLCARVWRSGEIDTVDIFATSDIKDFLKVEDNYTIEEALELLEAQGFKISLFSTDEAGTKEASISNGSFDISWIVYVLDLPLTLNIIEEPTNNKYYIGKEYYLSDFIDGLVVERIWSSGKKDTVNIKEETIDKLEDVQETLLTLEDTLAYFKTKLGYDIKLFNKDQVGVQTVSIGYILAETTFEVEVLDYLTRIFVLYLPKKTTYGLPFSAEDLNLSGGVIKKVYASGEDVYMAMDTLKWTVVGLDSTLEGESGESAINLSFDLGDTTWDWTFYIRVFDPSVAAEELAAACGSSGVAAFEAWASRGVLYVKVERSGVLEVLGVNGVLVRRFEVAASAGLKLALERGVYVLRMGGEVKKVVVE